MASDAFTYEGYRELLRDYLVAGYRFTSFPEVAGRKPEPGTMLMRHDIDFDLSAAHNLAEVEKQEGVEATYFFLLRTDHYNLFSKDGSAYVERILSLGHHLGLHFDCASYRADAGVEELARECRKEAGMLGEWFGRTVEIVSYHRPSSAVLTGNPALSAPLPHAYMDRFMKEMKYCSDSRGEWRYGDPRTTQAFADRGPMQILIHPVWWNHARADAQTTLSSWLACRTNTLEDSIVANCTAYSKRTSAGER